MLRDRLARLLRPRVSVGPAGTKHSAFANWLWNRSFSTLFPVPPGNQRHTVEMHLDALRAIGIPVAAGGMSFRAGPQAEAAVAKRVGERRLSSRRFILVHPTSRWMFKAWPAASMAELVNALIARGERIVLSAAPSAEERAYMEELKPRLRGDYLDLTGQLTLKELGALVAAARLLIGVDSMPVHLASAVGTHRCDVGSCVPVQSSSAWNRFAGPYSLLAPCDVITGASGGALADATRKPVPFGAHTHL